MAVWYFRGKNPIRPQKSTENTKKDPCNRTYRSNCSFARKTITPLRADAALIERLNQAIARGELKNAGGQVVSRPLDGGLLRADGCLLYPMVDEIPILLPDEAIGVVPP